MANCHESNIFDAFKAKNRLSVARNFREFPCRKVLRSLNGSLDSDWGDPLSLSNPRNGGVTTLALALLKGDYSICRF